MLFEQACGYASLEFGIRNDMQSRFSLASVSKQFTAFAVMLLADQRKLDLDRPANRYLPQGMRIDESITVHHLLSHTSGLPNADSFEYDFFGEYNRTNYTQHDYFRRYIAHPPLKPPGTAYLYNNMNYNLLAWIMEQVSGERFDDFLRHSLFQPLGMENSVVDDGCRIIPNRACNYVKDFDTTVRRPYYNEKFSIGAGAVVSNCSDLYKWYMGLRERKLLSPEAYARFFTENLNHYCYGLEHHRVHGTDRYAHGGDHLGIGTYVQYLMEEDLFIVILSNNDAINQYRLGHAILDILHGVKVTAPAKRTEIALSAEELKSYSGTYLTNKIELAVIAGKLYFKRFSGNLHIELYPVGKGMFARRYTDQIQPYRMKRGPDGRMTFFGFGKQDD